jgi:excisionase family DNA binding protein
MRDHIRKILATATYRDPRPDQVRIKTETRKLFDECLELTKGDASAAAHLVLADALLSPPTEPSPLFQSETLTAAEAAEELNLHRQTIYEMCRTGELESYRFGRAIRISRQGIERHKAKAPEVPPCMDLDVPDHVGGYKPKR